ncbi:MAG: PAS domain S-box protein [Deltaproteobacteria bacterium]|nr:PAS domain S-box protein [Deltaproteobacteria bacterium]
MIFIAFISIGLWSLIWIQGEYSTFKSESDSIRVKYLQSQKLMLKKEVTGVVKYIKTMRKQAEQKLEFTLKERVDEAHKIAMNIYQENTDSKDLSEIKKMIKDALRPIRFFDGRGYYFAFSMDGVEQLYPAHPEFEGKNLIGLQDSKGNFVIQDEIKMIKTSGEGFIKSYWSKPDKDPALQFPQMSFVKYFKPLDWYFGTGDYLDDFEAQIQKEILNRVIHLRFGAEGYFFGSTYQGDPLFSNGKITIDSGNVWNLTDPNGVKIIQEQRKAVENPEGGVVYYSWHKLNTSVLSPKISFVQGLSEWEWTIGAGIYFDTIEKTIFENKVALNNKLKKNIFRSILILAVLLCFVYFWSKRIGNQIQNSVKTFSSFLKKASVDSIMIDLKELQLKEFIDIAVSTNKMLEDRRQAEKALGESEEKFRYLFESINDSLFVHLLTEDDLPGRFIEVNDMACKKLGYSRQELLQLTPHDISVPENGINPHEIRDKLLTHTSTLFETMHLTKEGQRIPVESHIRLFDYDGQRTVLSIARDITDRKQVEKELRTSHERFFTVLNSIDATIYVADMETYEILFMNKYMIENFDRDMTGEICWKVFRGESGPCVHCSNDQLIDKNGLPTDVYIWQDKNPISKRWYNNYDRAIEWTDGRLVKLQIATDITSFKKIETQLQQAQKMESIGTLAGGIAHDFNNVLFPILGHTEMLLQDIPEDSPFRDSLNKIFTGGMRASELVKQILTFSRQESSEMKLMKAQPIIKEALKLIRSTIPTTIEIKQYIQPDCGVIKADPTQIHQIVMNLATNAYHAMGDTTGELKVNLKEVELNEQDVLYPDMTPGPYAWLTIADTGEGMDKNLTEKIFDPFFTTKEKGKGTGMGLSVVHGIVTGMKGVIKVYSEPGQGTEFNIYLPVVKSHSEQQEINQTKEPIQGGIERILLVDDEKAIIGMEKSMLERLGYQVTSRVSSIEALEAFRDNPDKFDLVITDMSMPNMPGDKFSAELTKIRPDIPILLCTGFSENMSEEKAESLGIKGFLLKPVVLKDLSQKIREVLDSNKNENTN